MNTTAARTLPAPVAARIDALAKAYAAKRAVCEHISWSDPYAAATVDYAFTAHFAARQDVRDALSRARAPYVRQAYVFALGQYA